MAREKAQSFLTDDHIERIVTASRAFGDEEGFTRVVGNDEILDKGGNLSIPLYVRVQTARNGQVAEDQAPYGKTNLKQAIADWRESSMALRESMDGLFELLQKEYPRMTRITANSKVPSGGAK